MSDDVEWLMRHAYASGRADEREEWLPVLEALQDVFAWLKATPEGYGTVPPDSIERARAAIAKATGAKEPTT